LPTEWVADLVPSGYYLPTSPDPYPDQRANATLLMLARNSDLIGAAQSVRRLEDRFNKNYRYPWVFLNDEPFSDEFKRCVALMFGRRR
jgi:alpha 1,2-mannosyltransferase